MLKDKLKEAVADLQKVYTSVAVRPGPGEGVIDLALRPANLHASNGDLAFVKILSANGLQAHGFVHSKDFSTLFLRDIREAAEVSGQVTEISKGDMDVAQEQTA